MSSEQRFDVIIIGAGVGGLAAAARLVAGGARTLVIERLEHAGGRFSSRQTDGFELATGAIVIPTGSALEESFQIVDAPFEVRIPEPQFRYRIRGRVLDLPPRGGLIGLTDLMAESAEEAERIRQAFRIALKWGPPLPGLRVSQWLDHIGVSAPVHDVFQAICGAWLGINHYEADAYLFVHYLRQLAHMRRFGWAPRGNKVLSAGLAEAIERRGAAFWYKCRVERILVERGTAAGVVVEREGQSSTVRAAIVVSDAGPRNTVELASPQMFDPGYRAAVEGLNIMPVVACYIRSRRPLSDFPGAMVIGGTRRVHFLATLTNLCPELAPRGWHLTETFGVPVDCQNARLDPKAEVEANLADLRDMFPDFDEHAELLRATTFRGDWPASHAWPGHDLPPRTPVENLYIVGDGAKPLGFSGTAACAESGRLAAEDILGRGAPVTAS